MKTLLGAMLLVSSAGAGDSAAVPDPVLALARVKRTTVESLNRLPDYTCLVTVVREKRPKADRPFGRVDIVRYEIAHVGGRELYSWPGERRFQDEPITSMVEYGVISSGEFGLHTGAVFEDGYANIRYRRRESLNGRDSLSWDYDIPIFGSGWYIRSAGRMAHVASHGSFWADAATLQLERLEVYADGIPPGFPNSAAAESIDYQRLRIGGREVLLPTTATIVLDEISGAQYRNTMEFSRCRQYSGESRLVFNATDSAPPAAVPPPAPEVKAADSKPPLISALAGGESTLPPKVRLRLQLTSAINSGSAAVGDEVIATVAADVVQHGRTAIPKGAIVRGRVRRLIQSAGPPEHFAVTLEFTDVEWAGNRTEFYGTLKRLETNVRGFGGIGRAGRFAYPPETRRGGHVEFYDIADVPGAATIFLNGKSFVLPVGTIMLWVTQRQGSEGVPAMPPFQRGGPTRR